MRPLLAAENLSRHFGGLRAVADVSLDLHVGTLHALIGPNGAGKSTLVNLLSGELVPSSGTIRISGQDITGRDSRHFARAGIGRTFQRTNVMRPMTVLENVRLAAQAMLITPRQLLRRAAREPHTRAAAEAALDRVGLAAGTDRIAGTLSHGELRLLEIAIALAGQPTVLLLDEPLAGMGPEESGRVAVLLRNLAADHAVLLIEHDMDLVFAVADLLTVMVEGGVLDTGTPARIRVSDVVRHAYLGSDT